MHQHDRAGADAVGHRLGEYRAGGGFVERLDLGAMHIDPPADFLDPFIQHRRQRDGEVEQPRAGLVADAQRIRKTAIDDQQGAVALALQQRVGGDRGAHLHRVDQAGGDRLDPAPRRARIGSRRCAASR